MWTISHVEPCRTRVFDTRFPFLHFLLHSPYSSFSPYTSPIDSSNLGSGATTQPHGFIISWHQSKNPNPKITILAPKQLPKFGFVDLDTGAACICWSQHQSALGFCFVFCFCFCFYFCFVLFFCFTSRFVVFGSGFGVLTIREIGKGENGEGKTKKMELECLNLKFHVDFSQHLTCASTLKLSLLCSSCYNKLKSKRLEMLFYKIVSNAY